MIKITLKRPYNLLVKVYFADIIFIKIAMNRYNNSIIFALSRRLSGSKTLKFLKRLLF